MDSKVIDYKDILVKWSNEMIEGNISDKRERMIKKLNEWHMVEGFNSGLHFDIGNY